MFSQIEKNYQKKLHARRFLMHFWPRAILVVMFFLLLDFMLGLKHWITYISVVAILLIVVALFFAKEVQLAGREFETVRGSKGFKNKLKAYYAADDKRRINNLAQNLAEHAIRTKSDLETTLTFYQSRLPQNVKPNFLEWFLTTIVTLASILVVAYNDEAGSINVREFESALVIAVIILVPFIIVKVITTIVSLSHINTDTILVEDLAYICVHYEEFEATLAQRSRLDSRDT